MLAALLRWLSRRRLAQLQRWGAAAGWFTYGASPTYRCRLREHARAAGLTPAQRREAVAHAGRMLLELPWLWMRPAEASVLPHVQWVGDEHLESIVRGAGHGGRGALLLTPHLGAFEVIAQAYAERYGHQVPMTALYRPSRKPMLRPVVEAARHRPGLLTAPANLSGVRQMIRALRRGEVVGLLPDQVPPQGMGVWAPFFGRPAYTMTLAARLAQQTGAELLPIRCERLPDGQGFRIHVTPMAEPLPVPATHAQAAEESHQVACATAINRELERQIRACPAQYLWAYHRYKSPRATLDCEAEACPRCP